ncbi:MAG: hypothetical protein J5667_01090 [Bacteroidales bacterium]|nr:hypothetical protein [Bacteroidales bacterium]
MKKFFIIAALALVASAACTKSELSDNANRDVEIGFQVASYLNQTKADSHDHTSFIDELAELGVTSNQSFNSQAFILAAQSDGTVADPAAFFSAGTGNVETIKYDGSSTWKPVHPYFWPKSPKSSITFFSWYDFSGMNPTIDGYATDGGAVTLAWTDRTVALKDNVMYADAAYKYKKNDNSTQNHKLDGVTEGVPTLFHHALAKVRFTVKQNPMKEQDGTTENYIFWDVTLSEVALSSGTIKNNGQFSLTETSSTTVASQGTWTLPTNSIWAAPTAAQTFLTTNLGNASGDIFDTDVARGEDSSHNPVLLKATVDTLTGKNFMAKNFFTVLPQEIGDDVTLTFKYTIKTYYGTEAQHTAGTATLISTETINVNDLGPTVGNFGAPYTDTGIQLNAITGAWNKWQMNHQYVYNIIINPKTSEIKYDPAVATWETEDTVNQTVPAA